MITDTFISVSFKDHRGTFTCVRNHLPTRYNDILNAVKAQNWERVYQLLDIKENVRVRLEGTGVEFKDGVLHHNGVPIHNVVTEKILEFTRKSLPITPMKRLLEKCLANPSHISVDNVYRFLVHNKTIPIDYDGNLIAFKKVDENFRSYHADLNGVHLDHTPGKEVSMPREDVDPNPSNTCSTGLHFCSKDYLNAYVGGSGKVVIVQVSPTDIVAVPPDYDNAKVRCCRYRVLREVSDEEVRKIAFGDRPLFERHAFDGNAAAEDDYEEEYEEEESYREEVDDYWAGAPFEDRVPQSDKEIIYDNLEELNGMIVENYVDEFVSKTHPYTQLLCAVGGVVGNSLFTHDLKISLSHVVIGASQNGTFEVKRATLIEMLEHMGFYVDPEEDTITV